MNTPLVSIIIPVYKVEKYVSKCIESIQAQTYPHWELLLINDGSPDGSGHICDEYSQQDSRIRVFHKENGGVSSARNLGLDNVQGDYVMFVDADDWLSDKCLEVCVNEMVTHQLDALHFGVLYVYDNKKVPMLKSNIGVVTGQQLVQSFNFNSGVGGGFYKHEVIERNKLRFSKELKQAEDTILVLSVFKHSQRVKYLDEVLYNYLQRSDSAVYNSKSRDLLLSCNALIDFSSDWCAAKSYIDSMIVLFIIHTVRNNDTPNSKLKELYDKQKVGKVTNASNVQKVFPHIAKLNFHLACWVIYMYFSVKRIFSLDLKLN